MEYKDYYKVLGVDRNADEKTIKSAYRKLTKKYHPDLNKGDKQAELKYRDVNEAYEVLGDKDKRSKYDQFGADWQHYQSAGGWPPGGGSARGGASQFDFSDIFSQFSRSQGSSSSYGASGNSDFFDMLFGSMGQGMGGYQRSASSRAPMGGRDLESDVSITLSEAYKGTVKAFTLNRPTSCPSCGGRGVNGNAVCQTCRGQGQVMTPRTLDVTIPAGVTEGSKIRVRGEGGSSVGGPQGDIYIKVHILEDGIYTIKKRDVHRDFWISLKLAILGGTLELPLPDGRHLEVKIKPGTQNGKIVRLSKLGLPSKKGTPGDLFIKLMVTMPSELDDKQKQLFEAFWAALPEKS